MITELRRESKFNIRQFPSPVAGNQIFPVCLRQIVNNTVTTSIAVNATNLLNSLVNANSATVAARIFGSVKITKVEMWSAQAYAGGGGVTATTSSAFTSIGIQWFSRYGQAKNESDYGDQNRPAHLMSKPPIRSVASDWISSGSVAESDNLINIHGSSLGQAGTNTSNPPPAGTVIDISFVVTYLDLASGQSAVTVAAVGLTAGGNYYRGIDGLAKATSVLSVVGLLQA